MAPRRPRIWRPVRAAVEQPRPPAGHGGSEAPRPCGKLFGELRCALESAVRIMTLAKRTLDQESGPDEVNMGSHRTHLQATGDASTQTEKAPQNAREVGTQMERTGDRPDEEAGTKEEKLHKHAKNGDAWMPEAAAPKMCMAVAPKKVDAMQSAGNSINEGSVLAAGKPTPVLHLGSDAKISDAWEPEAAAQQKCMAVAPTKVGAMQSAGSTINEGSALAAGKPVRVLNLGSDATEGDAWKPEAADPQTCTPVAPKKVDAMQSAGSSINEGSALAAGQPTPVLHLGSDAKKGDAWEPEAADPQTCIPVAPKNMDAMQSTGSSINKGSALVAIRPTPIFDDSSDGFKLVEFNTLRDGEEVEASGKPRKHKICDVVPIKNKQGTVWGLVDQKNVMLASCARAWPSYAPSSQMCKGRRLRQCALLLGDSITEYGVVAWDGSAGWVGRLEEHYRRRVDILNRGLSGYNSRKALAVLPRILEDHMLQEPLLFAVVMYGTNDACTEPHHHLDLPEYRRNLAQIVGLLQAQGCRRILVLSPPAVSERARLRSNASVQRYADAAKGVVEEINPEGGRVRFLNVFQRMRGCARCGELLDRTDGYHLSARGQLMLFEHLKLELPPLPHIDLPDCEARDFLQGSTVGDVRARFTWHANLP